MSILHELIKCSKSNRCELSHKTSKIIMIKGSNGANNVK